MEILIIALALKVLVPVAIFYFIIRYWYGRTEKRSNHIHEHLSFNDWYNVSFGQYSDEHNGVESETEIEFEIDGLQVSSLPFEHIQLCHSLEIKVVLSEKILKRNFRKLVLKYHPDRVTQSDKSQIEVATRKLIDLKKAFEFLQKTYFGKKSGNSE